MDIRVVGGDKLSVLARDLRVAGAKGLKKSLRRNLVAAAQPIRRDMKANALAIPVQGSEHTGLRASIARSVRISVAITQRTAGVRVFADPKRMPAGQRLLPVDMEGSGRRWRHPVYGHEDRWVTQPSHPFAEPARRAHAEAAAAAATAAIYETAIALERGE